ncbi:MAG: bile acid:sodium symporter family protein [Pseudomonadota bacterium]
MLALLFTLGLATLLPASGDAAVVVNWLANITVVLLFFFHGAKLARSAVIAGLTHWRLHVLVLACTFVMFPLLALLMSALFGTLLSPALWTGILFMAALPSTVQSSIAFVGIAKGNVPAAVASASASQLLGVLLTPLLVSLLSGAHGGEVAISGIGTVALQILLPFIVGHLLRPWLLDFITRFKSTIAITDRATILLAVYSAFSAAVIEGIWSRLPLPDFVVLFGLCCVMLVCALLFTRTVARRLHFSREDEIVIVFCGTKKSLIQGVPMARVLFAGPDLGLILLPIMIFHQVQLMVCAAIARNYAMKAAMNDAATDAQSDATSRAKNQENGDNNDG